MNKRIILQISLLIVLVISVWVVYESMPYFDDTEESITVRAGQSLDEVADNLHKEKLIKNKMFFVLYGKVQGLDGQVKKGTHNISSSQSIASIYKELITSPLEEGITVTIPEGFSVEQIASRLEKVGLIDRKAFLDIAKTGKGVQHPLLKEIKAKKGVTYRLEGYLFPDTYSFQKQTSSEAIIERMISRFDEVQKEIGTRKDFSLHEWVTLASIVEKEAVVDKERELIAGVFHNRMEDDWRLQSCATVQYVLDKPKERLLYKDLEVESPYNTYVNEGLPPGPISNPGKQSLIASKNADNHDYYFFVVKGDGSGEHHFSKTFKEHQKHTDHKGNW
ncbi:endolytic transglycosylase MltG [Pseudalkalibacillus sp. Hm43]|uniref:endolytic transglycosylase MltG n=1 Tax=Pseudalkalibacillus sp. Hm43 TaxID=3450742 RepID=UPI003F433A94